MRKRITSVFVTAAVGGTALIVLGGTRSSVSGAVTQGQQAAQLSAAETSSYAAAVPGGRLWVKRYNGPGNSTDIAYSVAVGPDGRTVFVTGQTYGSTSGRDYTTIAYNATTGTRRWVKRYNGPGNGDDYASSVAVSPGGKTVFVTGNSTAASSGRDYTTIAYSAATGARRWVKRYSGPGNGDDFASAVAVSPGGKTVFVTGGSVGFSSADDYATIAYNATTGTRRWVKRYNGPGNGEDVAHSVAVSPDGGTVFVTGGSMGVTSDLDYATVAYNAATGRWRWVKRYTSAGEGEDAAASVAVSPGGGTIFVTGGSVGNYATVAYNAITGAQRWVKRYDGPGIGDAYASSVAVSRGGGEVFVTGWCYEGATSEYDYATVAYNAVTGAQRWAERYDGTGHGVDLALSVAASPTDAKVFVTGYSTGVTSDVDYATVAYNG